MKEPPVINPSSARAEARPKLALMDYVRGIRAGSRMILGRAITLLESSRPADQAMARAVLTECLPHADWALRIGVTGAPGAGKSTLIERLGCHLIDQGERIAVLTTDPSSIRTGGSILGDKTRMPTLAAHDKAFVRPSPSGGITGGVTLATRQTIQLCEAAGFSTVLVETVGTGQSEIAARSMVDVVLLLVLARAGDELQAIKRGIIETADIIVIAKADGRDTLRAQESQRQYQRSLRLYPIGPSGVRTQVLTCSGITGDGVDTVWERIKWYRETVAANGYFAHNRMEQARLAVRQTAAMTLESDFFDNSCVASRLNELEKAVADGQCTPWGAAQELLQLYRARSPRG